MSQNWVEFFSQRPIFSQRVGKKDLLATRARKAHFVFCVKNNENNKIYLLEHIRAAPAAGINEERLVLQTYWNNSNKQALRAMGPSGPWSWALGRPFGPWGPSGHVIQTNRPYGPWGPSGHGLGLSAGPSGHGLGLQCSLRRARSYRTSSSRSFLKVELIIIEQNWG